MYGLAGHAEAWLRKRGSQGKGAKATLEPCSGNAAKTRLQRQACTGKAAKARPQRQGCQGADVKARLQRKGSKATAALCISEGKAAKAMPLWQRCKDKAAEARLPTPKGKARREATKERLRRRGCLAMTPRQEYQSNVAKAKWRKRGYESKAI